MVLAGNERVAACSGGRCVYSTDERPGGGFEEMTVAAANSAWSHAQQPMGFTNLSSPFVCHKSTSHLTSWCAADGAVILAWTYFADSPIVKFRGSLFRDANRNSLDVGAGDRFFDCDPVVGSNGALPACECTEEEDGSGVYACEQRLPGTRDVVFEKVELYGSDASGHRHTTVRVPDEVTCRQLFLTECHASGALSVTFGRSGADAYRVRARKEGCVWLDEECGDYGLEVTTGVDDLMYETVTCDEQACTVVLGDGRPTPARGKGHMTNTRYTLQLELVGQGYPADNRREVLCQSGMPLEARYQLREDYAESDAGVLESVGVYAVSVTTLDADGEPLAGGAVTFTFFDADGGSAPVDVMYVDEDGMVTVKVIVFSAAFCCFLLPLALRLLTTPVVFRPPRPCAPPRPAPLALPCRDRPCLCSPQGALR